MGDIVMLAQMETALKIKRLAKDALDTEEGNYRMYIDQLNKAWSMVQFDELITFVVRYVQRELPPHFTVNTKADSFEVIINRDADNKDPLVLFRVSILSWTHVRVQANRDVGKDKAFIASLTGDGMMELPNQHIVDYGRGDTDALTDRVIDELLRLE